MSKKTRSGAASPPRKSGGLVFRRYRRDPRTGRILDAWAYGLKAWPMHFTN